MSSSDSSDEFAEERRILQEALAVSQRDLKDASAEEKPGIQAEIDTIRAALKRLSA